MEMVIARIYTYKASKAWCLAFSASLSLEVSFSLRVIRPGQWDGCACQIDGSRLHCEGAYGV